MHNALSTRAHARTATNVLTYNAPSPSPSPVFKRKLLSSCALPSILYQFALNFRAGTMENLSASWDTQRKNVVRIFDERFCPSLPSEERLALAPRTFVRQPG